MGKGSPCRCGKNRSAARSVPSGRSLEQHDLVTRRGRRRRRPAEPQSHPCRMPPAGEPRFTPPKFAAQAAIDGHHRTSRGGRQTAARAGLNHGDALIVLPVPAGRTMGRDAVGKAIAAPCRRGESARSGSPASRRRDSVDRNHRQHARGESSARGRRRAQAAEWQAARFRTARAPGALPVAYS